MMRGQLTRAVKHMHRNASILVAIYIVCWDTAPVRYPRTSKINVIKAFDKFA